MSFPIAWEFVDNCCTQSAAELANGVAGSNVGDEAAFGGGACGGGLAGSDV